MSPRRPVWPWYGGTAALILLDQISKILVRQRFDLHESLSLLGGDLVRLTYVLNPGIAFGLRLPGPILLLIFGWLAAGILTVYLYTLVRRGDALRWPVMLFLAGAIGNSIDRALYGAVTDFLDVDFPDVVMERWPVFNAADSCVTIGIIWMIALLLFHRREVAPASLSPSTIGEPSDRSFGTRPGTHPVPNDDRPGPATGTD